MGIGPEQVQIGAIPLSHAYGLGNLLMPTLLQGTAVILREGFVPHALAADAHAYGADVFQGVPFMFEHLAAAASAGGLAAAAAQAGQRRARASRPPPCAASSTPSAIKIHSFYGTTEAGGIAYDDGDDLLDETTVGHPLSRVPRHIVAGRGRTTRRRARARGRARRLPRGMPARRMPATRSWTAGSSPVISAASTAAIAWC